MTQKSQKTRPNFFQDFQSSNQHGTVVKSTCLKKTCVLWARFPVRRVVYEPQLELDYVVALKCSVLRISIWWFPEIGVPLVVIHL